ncbi:MAG: flagellar export protein FliJ [Proteobacteria bacterium]|nr:MAG: flagellar export protein FliJ [Pseudomonadota bacterium]PIE67139.1 MAG: flagellar export protein FliJ [Deltaproteobacteria bacterium]
MLGANNGSKMYTFKLQAVLDHRQFIEDQLNKDFAEINQRIMTIKKQMDQLRRKEMETIRALKNEQSLGISSDQVIVYHAYLRQLGDRLANQAKTLVNVENEACEKRDALLDAVKRRKILEKLKAQGIDRYNRAILEDEMKFIDEIAVNQFARKSLNTNGGRE